jgi:hypothetical protein
VSRPSTPGWSRFALHAAAANATYSIVSHRVSGPDAAFRCARTCRPVEGLVATSDSFRALITRCAADVLGRRPTVLLSRWPQLHDSWRLGKKIVNCATATAPVG